MTITNQIDEFMASKLSTRWVGDEHLNVYVRKGRHRIAGNLTNTFDVANIVQDPAHCNKGYFRTFMQKVESLGLTVYVECILNPNLIDILQRNNYTIVDDHGSIHAIKTVSQCQ